MTNVQLLKQGQRGLQQLLRTRVVVAKTPATLSTMRPCGWKRPLQRLTAAVASRHSSTAIGGRWRSHALAATAASSQDGRQGRASLLTTGAALAALCGGSCCAAAQCEADDSPPPNSRRVLFPPRDDAVPHLDQALGEYDEDSTAEESSGAIMASSMMHVMPSPSQVPLPPKGQPMFAVQRQRRLNGWAALEAKEDLKQVQLAQLLNDLHKMTKELRPDSESAVPGHEEGEDTFEMEQEMEHETEQGLMFDATSITPEHTQHLLQQLRVGQVFRKTNLIQLINAGTAVLRQEPTLIDLSHKKQVYIVGDLHGSNENLEEVLRLIGDIDEDTGVVFNGDFVDRGKGGVEVVCTLLLLKLTYPDSVVLVRGNHEDSLLSTIYGFEDEVRRKYGRRDLKQVWQALSGFFAALPIAVQTPHAAIMHGGIPSPDFALAQLRDISVQERCQFSSLMEDDDDTNEEDSSSSSSSTSRNNETLCRDVLWSDPTVEDGFSANENRGLGKSYGADVSRHFLERHGLNYLIRSHEVMDEGWDVIDCGANRYVLTVFSTSAYPDGCGDNKGAVLKLDNETGKVDPIEFFLEPSQHGADQGVDAAETSSMLKSVIQVIIDNKQKLTEAFEAFAAESSDDDDDSTTVTVDEWAKIMEAQLEMGLDWHTLQSQLAPTKLQENADSGELQCTNRIDWRQFLQNHSVSTANADLSMDDDTMESLFSNHNMLLTVFRFLDTDGNGNLDQDEFVNGITLLNERLPKDRQFKDPLALFQTLDFDGSGEIDLDEFAAAFNVVSKPPDRAVLATIFQSLDTDNSGSIDIDEFRAGVQKLNQKLPHDRQVTDPDALFRSLDLDGSGEVDAAEFSAFYF